MPSLSVLNEEKSQSLLQHGVAGGRALAIDVSTVTEHVHSRAATIFRAQSTKHGDVAIKVIFAPDVREPHDIRKEVKLMAALSHANVSGIVYRRSAYTGLIVLWHCCVPQICPLLNAYYIERHYILAMPYYSKTVQDLLDNSTFVPSTAEVAFETVARSLIKQMCSAVAYLEVQQIAHRDISPPNFLLSSNGTIALTDFGVAWSAENPGLERTTNLCFELGTG
jgi:serine/threonine protein kinase